MTAPPAPNAPSAPTTPLPPPEPPAATPPRRSRPVLGIVVSILAVGLFGLAMIAAAAWMVRDTSTGSTSVAASDTLRFTADAGALDLVEADRDDIGVAWEATTAPWRDVDVVVDVVEGALEVTVGCPDGFAAFCSTATTIEVPRGSLQELEVDLDAGDVQITGSAADVVATTEAGQIVLDEYHGTSAVLRASAGRVEVDARVVPEQVDVVVDVGDVEISLPEAEYDVDASTNVGSASTSVRQVDGAPHRIVAHTDVGQVEVHAR